MCIVYVAVFDQTLQCTLYTMHFQIWKVKMIVCWTNIRLVRVKLKVIFPARHSSSDQSRR